MIDLVFAVDDPLQWHQQNLERNRDHYSWLCATLGADYISELGSKDARIYYNPFVRTESGFVSVLWSLQSQEG